VHGCQGYKDPGVRGGGRLDGLVDLAGQERLEDGMPGPADPEAAGRVAEDDAVLLCPGEQRPGGDQGRLTPRAVQLCGDGADIVAGDLAQAAMAGRPFQQCRAERGDVGPDGLVVQGRCARSVAGKRVYTRRAGRLVKKASRRQVADMRSAMTWPRG
jgi:hypothetical protein